MIESFLVPIVISLSQKTITLPEGKVVPIGIGKTTPTGNFFVRRKVIDPIDYSHITGKPIEDGTYGSYAILICDEHTTTECIGIHGTNDQSSIGKEESAGCIRIPREYEKYVFDSISFISDIVIE